MAPRRGSPIVIVNGADFTVNLSTAEARAFSLLCAAEAAEADAFLVAILRQAVRLDREKAGEILVEFRKWKEARESSSDNGLRIMGWLRSP